ncbi:MAG TPA: IMP dehydrogenase [bacterium]|nr:IMP dehydrogenase [bacterium]HQL61185.1 IMP dehydrogenase [bacterium]
MTSERIRGEGLTFDDILLLPNYAELLPSEIDTSVALTEKIRLAVPLLSAPMDTVTDSRLAIALAQEGGLGILHRNVCPEEQAKEVDRVKRSESGMIVSPITLPPTALISEALEIMARYHISGVPITKGTKLVGILTNRDLRFETDTSKRVTELMTPREKLVTAPVGTTLDNAVTFLHGHRIEKLPVVDDENNLVGLITIKDIEKKRRFPNAAKDSIGRLLVGAAVGVSPADREERLPLLASAGVDAVVVDTAHGFSKRVGDMVEFIKSEYPQIVVIGGNVATGEGTKYLVDRGADVVRVGVGPGSICTTRVVTGAGVPQVTAIVECAKVADTCGIPIIADGGIRFSGDITKAIAAGAIAVMIGNLFAGTEEAPGETVVYEGRTFKVYRGMGSLAAMKEGSGDRYGQGTITDQGKLVPEGIEGRVPYKGSLSAHVFQLVGGLRSGMGYCGVKCIEELRTKTQFMKVTANSLQESHPHDVAITREAPNYRRGGF